MRRDEVVWRRKRWWSDASDEWEALLAGVLVELWRWRLELAVLALLVAAQQLLSAWLSDGLAGALVVAVIALLLVVPVTRRRIVRGVRDARVRRSWDRAVIDAGVCSSPLRGPRITDVRRSPVGEVLRVRMHRGSSVGELEARAERLAVCLRVREVRALRDPGDGAMATVALARRDPFASLEPLPWPHAGAEETSLWESIPLGVDEQGAEVAIRLVERNVLIGGEPGAGKSAALSMLIAAAALDPGARVWLLDGKLVELAAWAPVAERLAGPDADEAVALLRAVQAEMEARYRELLARGRRKVERDDGLPLHLVVCDELAFYLSLPDKSQRQEFAELLRDLVARGRAAGVIVCAATQKPGADVVPTALRDLFAFRLALRCSTPQASDTILGQGWATAGADASTVPGGQRGVGYLLAEGDRPVRLKSFYLGDEHVQAIVERAAARRADAWLSAGGHELGEGARA